MRRCILLGQNYEGQIARVRLTPICDAKSCREAACPRNMKAAYIADLTKHASENYAKILTRYPLMDRSDDAKKRLSALHQPVPRPTKADVAQKQGRNRQPG